MGFRTETNTILASDASFKPKLCRGNCRFAREFMDEEGRKHKHHISVAKHVVSQHCMGRGVQNTTHTRDQLYRAPPRYIRDILEAVGGEE